MDAGCFSESNILDLMVINIKNRLLFRHNLLYNM